MLPTQPIALPSMELTQFGCDELSSPQEMTDPAHDMCDRPSRLITWQSQDISPHSCERYSFWSLVSVPPPSLSVAGFSWISVRWGVGINVSTPCGVGRYASRRRREELRG